MHVATAAELIWYDKHAKRDQDTIVEHVFLAERISVPMHFYWALTGNSTMAGMLQAVRGP